MRLLYLLMTKLGPPTGLGVLELEVDRGVGLRFARAALRLVPVVAVLLRGVGVLPIFLMSFSERADRSLPGVVWVLVLGAGVLKVSWGAGMASLSPSFTIFLSMFSLCCFSQI